MLNMSFQFEPFATVRGVSANGDIAFATRQEYLFAKHRDRPHELLWKIHVGGFITHCKCFGDRVYVITADRHLVHVDGQTGSQSTFGEFRPTKFGQCEDNQHVWLFERGFPTRVIGFDVEGKFQMYEHEELGRDGHPQWYQNAWYFSMSDHWWCIDATTMTDSRIPYETKIPTHLLDDRLPVYFVGNWVLHYQWLCEQIESLQHLVMDCPCQFIQGVYPLSETRWMVFMDGCSHPSIAIIVDILPGQKVHKRYDISAIQHLIDSPVNYVVEEIWQPPPVPKWYNLCTLGKIVDILWTDEGVDVCTSEKMYTMKRTGEPKCSIKNNVRTCFLHKQQTVVSCASYVVKM